MKQVLLQPFLQTWTVTLPLGLLLVVVALQTITELIRECGTDQAEQEQRAREATDIKAAEEAATPEVYRRRSELLRSHSLKVNVASSSRIMYICGRKCTR